MKTIITRLLIAAILAVAAWLSWSESKLAAEVADARQAIATFDYDAASALTAPPTLSEYLPGGRRLSDDVRVATAHVAYWLGRHDGLAADTAQSAADVDVLLPRRRRVPAGPGRSGHRRGGGAAP